MTLGLTSTGAVKIKTDGGLRAVNCACCGTLACGCMFVSAALKTIIESSTTVTGQGNSVPWNGVSAGIPQDDDFRSWTITYNAGVLCVYLDDGIYGGMYLLPLPFTVEECAIVEGFGSASVMIIQGQSYRSLDFFSSLPYAPTLSFS